MKYRISLLLLLLLMACVRPGRADDATTPLPEYKLGMEDTIEIVVLNHTDLNRVVTVLPDGTIAFPPIGEMKALGKSAKALAAEIRTELEKTRNNVEVTIAVKEIKSRKVGIAGAVKSGNSYDLRRGWRLMDLVAAAGGLSVKPRLVKGRVLRPNGTLLTLDLMKATLEPDSDANVPLQSGDLVLLDEKEGKNQVHVMGQVLKPNVYELDENLNLMTLLSLAGNPTDRAALKQAYIMRGPEKIPMDLYKLLVEGKQEESLINFKLQPNDILFIPELRREFGVMGSVAKPGYYPIPEKAEDLTLLKALGMAGGQAGDGDIRRAGLIRTVNGKPTVIPVDIDKMLRTGKVAQNVVLQPEDILYIPSKKTRMNWYEVVAPLSALSYLGIRLFR